MFNIYKHFTIKGNFGIIAPMRFYFYFKYAISFIIAVVLAIVTLPVFIITAIAIKIEDGGKVIFSQERTGRGMKRFKVYKFRTMKTTDVVFDKNRAVISANNSNVTKVGKFIRKFKIDELPQIYNVLKGDMCFISPRPLMPTYECDYKDWEKVKFFTKPGMTGLGQVNGNGYLSTEERNYYDVYYVMHASPIMDIKIIFKTLGVILHGEEKYIRHVKIEDYCKLRTGAKALWDKETSFSKLFIPKRAV